MNLKLVIFLLIFTFVIASTYSSTPTQFVSARTTTGCTPSTQVGSMSTQTCCTITFDDETNLVVNSECTTTSCDTHPDGICSVYSGDLPLVENNIKPEDLPSNIKPEDLPSFEDTTKVPKTDVLPDDGVPPLTSDDDNDKGPKVPNDLGGLQDEDESPTINPNLP